MKKITGKDLKKLGFKKRVEEPTLDPEDLGYHYYIYKLNEHCLLISSTNDEKIDGGYEIEFYEMEGIKFRDLGELKKLVKLLKHATNE
jgi:hypothetical protein